MSKIFAVLFFEFTAWALGCQVALALALTMTDSVALAPLVPQPIPVPERTTEHGAALTRSKEWKMRELKYVGGLR